MLNQGFRKLKGKILELAGTSSGGTMVREEDTEATGADYCNWKRQDIAMAKA